MEDNIKFFFDEDVGVFEKTMVFSIDLEICIRKLKKIHQRGEHTTIIEHGIKTHWFTIMATIMEIPDILPWVENILRLSNAQLMEVVEYVVDVEENI